jgi:hypothetical protein
MQLQKVDKEITFVSNRTQIKNGYELRIKCVDIRIIGLDKPGRTRLDWIVRKSKRNSYIGKKSRQNQMVYGVEKSKCDSFNGKKYR